MKMQDLIAELETVAQECVATCHPTATTKLATAFAAANVLAKAIGEVRAELEAGKPASPAAPIESAAETTEPEQGQG